MAKVLVIDDDPDVRQLLVNFLTEIGLRVVQAADGSSGLSLISPRRGRPAGGAGLLDR